MSFKSSCIKDDSSKYSIRVFPVVNWVSFSTPALSTVVVPSFPIMRVSSLNLSVPIVHGLEASSMLPRNMIEKGISKVLSWCLFMSNRSDESSVQEEYLSFFKTIHVQIIWFYRNQISCGRVCLRGNLITTVVHTVPHEKCPQGGEITYNRNWSHR